MDWETQRPRAPSTPTSESSHSTSGTNSSRERIPPYKQLNPSPVVTTLSKLSDDDLFRKGGDELLRMLRRVEADYKGLLTEHSNVVKDVNRRFQIFVLEARGLKEINQKLQDDNQELRDLCCFLDDDRQRSRKLAREWQRFGRYTASVMHSEVAAYQEKLRQLEDRQAELLSDNMELKELCLFLDHERSQMSGDRDDGDGSSNGTVPGQEDMVQSHGDSDGQITPTPTPTPSQQPNESTGSAYVRQLELKIQRLEEEKKQLAQRVERNGADGYHPADASRSQPGHASDSRQGGATTGQDRATPTMTMNKPEAVVHAMKVLQVHEQLERPQDAKGTDNLENPQKAIVREMCNVVWRKLGDVGEYPPHTAVSASFPVPQAATAPSTSYRPQSAAGNPYISSGHPGPPAPSKPLPSSLSLPSSPTAHGSTDSPDSHGHMPKPLSAAGAPHGEASSPGQGGVYSGERRSQLPQGPKFMAGPSSGISPGRREDYGQGGGGLGIYGQGGGGRENAISRENMPGHGARGRENFAGQKGPRHGQGQGHPQPVAHPAHPDRQRQLQPPPYSSAKTSPVYTPSHGPGPYPDQHPSQYPPPPHSHSQPPPHQQPPMSRQAPQQLPPRYQQRVHPHSGNQGPPPSSQGLPHSRSASASTTYYVSHPTSQSKSRSASALPTYHQPNPSSSVPATSFMYTQRAGDGHTGPPPQFRSFPGSGEQAARQAGDSARPEWRQTYLDD